MDAAIWYSILVKPFWAPPAWLFGPVWTLLYFFIALSFGYVLYLAIRGKVPSTVAVPFVLNLVFNFAFSPVQFALQNNLLAVVDMVLVLGTLIWALVVVYPFRRWVVAVNVPYLFWVLFATVLQFSITYLNW